MIDTFIIVSGCLPNFDPFSSKLERLNLFLQKNIGNGLKEYIGKKYWQIIDFLKNILAKEILGKDLLFKERW